MAEKSPAVHPTRHRNVLTPARLHVGGDDQKARDASGSCSGVVVVDLPHVSGLLCVHSTRRCDARIVADAGRDSLGRLLDMAPVHPKASLRVAFIEVMFRYCSLSGVSSSGSCLLLEPRTTCQRRAES